MNRILNFKYFSVFVFFFFFWEVIESRDLHSEHQTNFRSKRLAKYSGGNKILHRLLHALP